MSDEPTERDVNALAELVAPGRRRNGMAAARAVLASNWYAERIAQARREGAAEALARQSAAAWDEGFEAACDGPLVVVNPYRAALRGDA